MSAPVRQFLVLDLGLRGYAEALAFQRALATARIDRRIVQDVLVLVEHPPVVTLGRSAKAGHLIASRELLAARGVGLFDVERGGDVTFHGPGQLVGYPIVDLSEHTPDLHWYLRQVEEVLIRGVAPFGISAERNPGRTGVWTNSRKLASIGVHARQWVTWHGFALNVTTDLSFFDLIIPCGIADVTMTSVARELAERSDGAADGAAVRSEIVRSFAEVFGREPVDTTLDAIEAAITLAV